MMKQETRQAGILMPISALPSPYGIGCFSREAYDLADRLFGCGQRVWQILPLSPTSYGDSPYQSFSAFAGNLYFIDPEGLIREGLSDRSAWDGALGGEGSERIDYALQYRARLPLLREAGEKLSLREDEGASAFFEKAESWLSDYALFMAIKDSLGGAPLCQWPRELRRREARALEEQRARLGRQIESYRYLQYRFFTEWQALRGYANERGVRIVGDLPIYVSADSADVWAHPELFLLDGEGEPLRVAGCPPDDFTPDGQLWGNPLYRWEAHRGEDYAWWIARLAWAFELYDGVRIDHFRGFDSYYSIPSGAKNARDGRWEKGIGGEMFRVAEEVLGRREILAEDLGYVTDSVRALLASCGFPGMKILQFGFGGGEEDFSSDDLPHNYPAHCVAYTGTHDNDTLLGWLTNASEGERRKVSTYLQSDAKEGRVLCEQLIATLMRSPAKLCIVPMQDYLGLSSEGRINLPARADGNWQWRMAQGAFDEKMQEKIRKLCLIGGRIQQRNT